MGERLGRAVRGWGTFLLSALSGFFSLPKRFLKRARSATAPGTPTSSTDQQTVFQSLPIFLQKTSIFISRVVRIIIVNPVVWIVGSIWRLVKRFWAFLGRCGLALRNLLNWTIWKPLLFVTWPLRWFLRCVLLPPLRFVYLSLSASAGWLLIDVIWTGMKKIGSFIQPAGGVVARPFMPLIAFADRVMPGRRDRIEKRMVEFGGRYQHGTNAAYPKESRAPGLGGIRLGRLTTAVVTTGILIFLGVLTSQGQPTGDAVAMDSSTSITRQLSAALIPKMTLTPTIPPKVTPEPTPLPALTPARVAESIAWPTPDPLADSGSIVFTARENGNGDLYALTVGHPEPVRLTSHPAEDRSPAWSPDGQQLAFSSHRDGNWEIYILELPSGTVQRVTNSPDYDGEPSWSPDGLWLVYESYSAGNMDLYIIDAAEQRQPIRVTEHPALDMAPSWSPDGRHIAFTSWRSGNKDIFIMDLDAATDKDAVNVTGTPGRDEDQAVFDRSGRSIAYTSLEDGLELIYSKPLENYRPEEPETSLGRGHTPGWSPDGGSLSYITTKGSASFITAASLDPWSVTTQAYTRAGIVRDLDWSGLLLPLDIGDTFGQASLAAAPLYVEKIEAQGEFAPKFLLQEIDIEAPSPYLSDRVDDSFNALRQRVVEEAGWDFLGEVDNMFSFLTAAPYPGEPEESWNKAARAFDFYIRYPISIDPQVEIVREDRGVETYWRVYLRAAVQDGSRGEPLRERPWDFTARYDAEPRYYDQGGRLKEMIPAGYYIDFTTLASDYGWTRTSALNNWRTYFQGIRYWHFENHQDLSWEEAILELYTADEIEQIFGND